MKKILIIIILALGVLGCKEKEVIQKYEYEQCVCEVRSSVKDSAKHWRQYDYHYYTVNEVTDLDDTARYIKYFDVHNKGNHSHCSHLRKGFYQENYSHGYQGYKQKSGCDIDTTIFRGRSKFTVHRNGIQTTFADSTSIRTTCYKETMVY